jgi:hypothetical protein
MLIIKTIGSICRNEFEPDIETLLSALTNNIGFGVSLRLLSLSRELLYRTNSLKRECEAEGKPAEHIASFWKTYCG